MSPQESRFYRYTLDNGIRVVAEVIPTVRSVALGVWVRVGSRDEREEEAGIAHFIEHMCFKGTRRRSARQIALEVDSLGGELNAFTSRETTAFYCKVLDEHLERGMDLLVDLSLHARFDRKEIEKEKQVVLEEIKMVEDDPEEYIHDLHNQSVWDGNALARPVLGSPETVQAITREAIRQYVDRYYHPQNTIVSVAGHFHPEDLREYLNRTLGQFRRRGELPHRAPPELHPGVRVFRRKTEQVHLCLGALGLPQAHRDRYSMYALNALLGSSMSSRLFQEIRERRGLVYAIYSYLSSFEDTGLFHVYAATSPSTALEVVSLILREFRKVQKNGIQKEELERVRNQMKGNLLLSLESTTQRMNRLARDEIYLGRYESPEEIQKEIERIQPEQIHDLARRIFQSRHLSLVVLGPVRKQDFPPSLLEG